MPRTTPYTSVTFKSAEEMEEAKTAAATKGLSLSNYLRKGIKLPPILAGGKRKDAGRPKTTTLPDRN